MGVALGTNGALVALGAMGLSTIACILQLLISVGTPIWHVMSFLQTPLNNQQIRMGIWGLCTSLECNMPSLGYTWFSPVPENVPGMKKRDAGAGQGPALITSGPTRALIVHPIATFLCFLSTLTSMWTWVRWNHRWERATLWVVRVAVVVYLLATATTLAGWGITFGVTLVARERVRPLPGAQPSLGPAFWLPVASSACMALSTIFQAWASGMYERWVTLAQRQKAWLPHVVPVKDSKDGTSQDASRHSRYEPEPHALNRGGVTAKKSDSDQSPTTPLPSSSVGSPPSHSQDYTPPGGTGPLPVSEREQTERHSVRTQRSTPAHDSRTSEYHDSYEPASTTHDELFYDAASPKQSDAHRSSLPQTSHIPPRTIQRRRTREAYSRISAQVRNRQRPSVVLDDRSEPAPRARTQSHIDLLHYGAYPRYSRTDTQGLDRRVRSTPGVHHSGQGSSQKTPRYVRSMLEVSGNQGL